MGRGVQQTDRGNRDVAAAIGETLSPPRTDRPFALDQAKTRTSTPGEVLNGPVIDNPEGVRSSALARTITVFGAVRSQHDTQRDGRSPKPFATTRHSRPRSTLCGAWPRTKIRTSLHLSPTNVRGLIPASPRPRQSGASGEMSAAPSSRHGFVTAGEDPQGASEAAAGGA